MRPDLPCFSKNALAMSAVAVLSVSVLAACTSSGTSSGSSSSSTTSPGNSTGPITIGASLSLTGDFSADGQAFEKGYKMWDKDINAHGGLLGRHQAAGRRHDEHLVGEVDQLAQVAAARRADQRVGDRGHGPLVLAELG